MRGTVPDWGLSWADILRTWQELDVPEGWRPEISPEGIVVTPPPNGAHNLIAAAVHRALVAVTTGRFEVFQTLGVAVPSIGGIFIPDLCVVPTDAIPHGTEPPAGHHVVLAVEITSRSNAEHDRKRKKWAYAHAPVGQYLLIDAFDEDGPSVCLFSNPAAGVYRDAVRTAFGQALTLGPPLAMELDSRAFSMRP
jgi:Uma2 family endonuclease